MKTQNAILDQIAIVSTDISCWAGQKVMEDEDIALGDGGKLPDSTAATKGAKFLVLPKRLKPLRSSSSRNDSYLASIGLKFGKAYLIPVSKLADVLAQLEEFKTDHQKAVDEFCRNYLKYVDECANNNEAEFSSGNAIRNAAPSQDWVRNRFGYEVIHYKMLAETSQEEEKLVGQVTGLAGRLLQEIEEDAEKFLRNKHNQKVWSDKTLSPLKRWKEKLESLAFLDQRFSSLVSLLDDAINAPDNGIASFNRALAAALVMSNSVARDAYLESGLWQQTYGQNALKLTDYSDCQTTLPTEDLSGHSDTHSEFKHVVGGSFGSKPQHTISLDFF